MNNKKPLIAIAGSALFIAIATVGLSVAWFTSVATTRKGDSPIGGIVQDTYYESGEGSEESPYIITRPRHLYNLAWLQDLGFYNKHDGSEDDHQYYFKLGADIDMSRFSAIPPIGTEQNPFVGNFNGDGHVITGVTITNNFSEFSSHPSVVAGWNGEVLDDNEQPIAQPIEKPHILGLFGVVGDYSEYSQAASKPTVYDSEVNEFKNTGISGATIKTSVKDSLMGVAAGYVDANMSNVVVDVSTVNIDSEIAEQTTSYGGFTQNISDYTLVGYTTNAASVKRAEESIYDIEVTSDLEFNAQDQADDEGWGGSINMKTIYYRLYAFKANKAANVEDTFNWREEKHYYDNELKDSETVGTKTISQYSTDDETPHLQRFNGSEQATHQYIGNYNYLHRLNSLTATNATTDQSYLYLCGGHDEIRTYSTYYNHTGYYITDGTHYLSVENGSITDKTSSSEALLWSFSNTSGTAKISCQSNGTTYYLRNNNGALTLTTAENQGTTWTLTSNGNTLKITNNGYKLLYYQSQWMLSSGTYPYYHLTQNNRYMTTANSGSTPGNTNNANNASHWFIEQSTQRLYYLNGTTKMYLAVYYTYTVQSVGWITTRYSIDSTIALRVINNDSANNYYYFTYNSGTPVAVVPIASLQNDRYSDVTLTNTNHYFRYNNNAFTYNTGNNNRGTCVNGGNETVAGFDNLSINNTLNSAESTASGPDYHQTASDSTKSSSESHMYYEATDTTYFPINVENDVTVPITDGSNGTIQTKINSGDLDPKDSNTGYIISGSNLHGQNTYSSANANIRVSEYPSNAGNYNISQSFSTSYNTPEKFLDSGIRTITTSGTTTNMGEVYSENDYPRYKDSKLSFYKNSLTTAYNAQSETYTCTNNVYGLHFMDSTISANNIVNAEKVSILGSNSDHYQFPVDSIDFNLKQKGVINFFAGTYFSGNNSFFSLHQVFRNDDAVVKGDPQNKEYTSYNTISQIKEIEEIYSTDVGTKTTKYANIYKYKGATGTNMYSVPYRVDANQNKYEMNKNSTADMNTPYTYATMNEADFNTYKNTYGYALKFKTSQIGKQNSNFTLNYIYYFEFPMNSGEYCLGSVTGGTGAYLLYLDIGANAAKTQRTIFYEHFVVREKTFTHPVGVALLDLEELDGSGNRVTVISVSQEIDYSDSACMEIIPTAKGAFTIDRDANNVDLTRANPNKAPPVYAGENITRVYETTTSKNVTVDSLTSHDYDIRRMEYYDYNVNLEYLTVTVFADYGEDTDDNPNTPMVYHREYVYQTVYSGNNTSSEVVSTYKYNVNIEPVDEDPDDGEPAVNPLDLMKIYSTDNGIKFDAEDILNVEAIVIDEDKMSSDLSDLLVTFKLSQENGDFYEDMTSIAAHVDLDNDNGTYYLADNYIISFIPTSGSTIVIKITELTSGATVYYETTQITEVDQTITEGPQP